MKRLAFFLALMLSTAAAVAQGTYPTKPIRVINPFPPGGPVDVVGRPVLERLGAKLGQPLIMENKPGAGTAIGSGEVARAAPDGYVLLLTASQHAINPSVYPKLPYDTVKDFDPVSVVATGPFVLVVHPSVPAKNLEELIALAKAQPGKLNFASASSGSGFHMAGEMFNLMAGVKVVHVPYKGGAPATTALLAGEVEMMFASVAAVLPHVRAGKLRAIAVTTLTRSPLMPDLPTMSEAGLPGFEVDTWYGFFAPAGTPRDVTDKLRANIDQILREPEIREIFNKAGLEPGAGTRQQFVDQIAKDMAKWSKVAKESGAKAD